MSNKRLFLDLHAIQTVPPSNINRDDTGSPKTAQYGGVRRARVSSQSWKRAMRKYFDEFGDQFDLGVRTKYIVAYVSDKIRSKNPSLSEEEAKKRSINILNKIGFDVDKKSKKDDGTSNVLIFLSEDEAKTLANAALDKNKEKDIMEDFLSTKPALDIALFGRMVAGKPKLCEDASCQVAHAISTHGVQTEFDFYTAVDDLTPEDISGAAMMDTIEYNSSTLYRYANIAIHELVKQLNDKEKTVNALCLFVEAFIQSMPTGKITSFANQTLPQGIVLFLRKDRPVNLVTAFETPIRSKKGYVDASIEGLFEEAEKAQKFTEAPALALCLLKDERNEYSQIAESVQNDKELYGRLRSYLGQVIDEMQEA
ncbi:CRISPR system Cascade subunit CasC [Peptoniphilus ivorii]|uniref:type I-E CRISPR-associated protein Cas7/Cse4/CasC n=1 Tax=Aedoeadaptatus ivorii TaxID=54006 RepID=UPI002784E306|nr:type I-E CRISPR-associated protein Cas7/Cse4/CasC [Peptoniphilus ivorii]MDQ0508364.1 CRISPR system Cascade subunit CasC [Peptoniphilus ivorii]